VANIGVSAWRKLCWPAAVAATGVAWRTSAGESPKLMASNGESWRNES